MDFKGQRLCLFLCYLIIGFFSVLGAILGIIMDSFYVTFLVICIGGIIASIVCIPDWPFYNKEPLEFAKSKKED